MILRIAYGATEDEYYDYVKIGEANAAIFSATIGVGYLVDFFPICTFVSRMLKHCMLISMDSEVFAFMDARS